MNQLDETSVDIYKTAGWLSITSAILAIPLSVITIIQMLKRSSGRILAPFSIILLLLTVVFGLYAVYKFRDLLNRKYEFHKVDTLITIVILGSILMTCERVLFRLIYPAGMVPMLVLIVATGIPLSIVGIMFAARLLELNDDLNGLLKPLAYTYMVACILFLTIILSDFGHIALIAFHVMLGIALIRSGRESLPEFV